MEKRKPVTGSGSEGSIATDISVEVAAIVSAAESAAAAIRHRADQEAQARRREAEVEARGRLSRAAVEADQLVVERLRRISELSDSVVERARAVVDQLDQADEARRQLNGLLAALAKTAERVAQELDDRPDTGGTGAPPQAPVARFAPPPQESRQSTPPQEPRESSHVGTSEGGEAGGDAASTAVTPPAVEAERPPADEVRPLAAPAAPGPAEGQATAEVVHLARPPAVDAEPGAAPDSRQRREAGDMDGARLVALQMAVAGSTRGEVATHLKREYHIAEPHGILDDVFGEG